MYNHCLVTQNLLQNTSINAKMSASYRLAKSVADAWQCIIAFRPCINSLSEKVLPKTLATVNIKLPESSCTVS